jgi:AraC family transcriptional regulator
MAAGKDHRAPHEIIETERIAYLDALPPPDPDWPPDVRIVYEDLHDHLFDLGLRINDVKQRCGIGNHNISCRFKHFVGRAPKAYAVHHRVALAKRLLHHKHLTVAQVAFAVGYASPNGFSTTFKRQVGVSPTAFRRILRQDL